MDSPRDTLVQEQNPGLKARRQLLKAGVALAALPIAATAIAAAAAGAKAAGGRAAPALSVADAKSEEFINGLADLMAHSTRTPVLRWPNEYGMEFEEIFFPAMDGVTVEGWFIPANSDRLIICNHPMPCNRYGYPGLMRVRVPPCAHLQGTLS